MTEPIRISKQTVFVLEALLEAPGQWRYGYDLSRETGLKSGTLYPVLMRLTDRGWLMTRWEESEPGRPARHMYRLSAEGARAAREMVTAGRQRGFVLKPSAHEGGA